MPEQAIFFNKLNMEIDPSNFDEKAFYAVNLRLNGQRLEGEKVISEIIKGATQQQIRDVRSSHSHKFFRKGEVAKGIDTFLGINLKKETTFQLMGMKRWDGRIQKGKTVYIYEGGGIGDTFINIRFMKHIKDRGMNPIFYSNLGREDVLDVMYRNGFNVTTRLDNVDLEDFHTESMCLPVDLNVKEEDLWYGPYLKARKDPKNDLGPKKKFRIGIKCNGNPYFAQDIYRSIPIEQILAAIPQDVEIYYFDIDNEHPDVINLKGRLNNWEDTLDYVDQMDLILSSCTSLPHISGAMGITTIVVPPITEYYVWSSSRADDSSPWYGSNFHVYKQTKVHSWDEPLAKATKLIKQIIGEKNGS